MQIGGTLEKRHHAFDWDDNILFMPTHIILFNKKNEYPKEILITTEDFAKYRTNVGESNSYFYAEKIDTLSAKLVNKKTELKLCFLDFEIEYKNSNGEELSFREFRDCDNKYFLKHLKEALENKKYGPSWNSFLYATSNKKDADNSYIITARGHSPQTIYDGLKLMKELGIIEHLIPRKNIFPVSYHKLKISSLPTSKSKFKVLKDIFKKINLEAKNGKFNHELIFSDDDLTTIKLIREQIEAFKERNWWNSFTIKVHFTGENEEISIF